MNPCDYFFWCYLKDCVYHTNPHTVLDLQIKIETITQDITGCMTHLTTLWFMYSKSIKLKDLILNMCSREDNTHTNSHWKSAFIHVSQASLSKKTANIPISKLLCVLLHTLIISKQYHITAPGR